MRDYLSIVKNTSTTSGDPNKPLLPSTQSHTHVTMHVLHSRFYHCVILIICDQGYWWALGKYSAVPVVKPWCSHLDLYIMIKLEVSYFSINAIITVQSYAVRK